ncbi:MAG TPA: hypothetical protein VHP63_03190 [candidate division Zixibacteria bacterium]|nr:hypothetical protein [candidate division Zixibacteria bacterium]
MPGSYEIDSKENLIRIHSSGIITVDEKIKQDEMIMVDPNYKKSMNVICDLSEATFDWGMPEIDKFRGFVKRHKGSFGKSKWAVIAAGGATEHAAKIFSVLQTAYDNVVNVQVFNNRDKALKWLKE